MMNNLINFNNYYYYADMIKTGNSTVIYVPDLNINNIDEYVEGIINILKDGIETEFIKNARVILSWGDNLTCKLNLPDAWLTLFMWKMLIKTEQEIRPKHIFWNKELKVKNIKNYVDSFVLTRDNKIKFGNYYLNNVIADTLWNYADIEQFAFWLCNTINNEDDIILMNLCPEFYNATHADLSNVPLSEVNNIGMDLTNNIIDIIKDSYKYLGYDHGLANSFRASEAISPRQFKEVEVNIGTKSNGTGIAFPYVINRSYKNGGINTPLYYLMEASAGRAAQIMSKQNVGDYGDIARLLGLNNTDTILNHNTSYECFTKHFIKYEIKTAKHLSMIKDRRYRNIVPYGMEYTMSEYDTHMIGKTVYLRSPMTCASNSNGFGICKACYGDLYYTNLDINVGKFAAENLSSQETQKSLSAKHLMETLIMALKWNKEFETMFVVDTNIIKIDETFEFENDLRKYTMIINPSDIELVSDEEDSIIYERDDPTYTPDEVVSVSTESINKFIIKTPSGERIVCKTEDDDDLYITQELNQIIRKKAKNTDDMINIKLSDLFGADLFYVKVNNNELSKLLNDVVNCFNKASCVNGITKDEALQNLVDSCVEVGLNVDSVHLEVILSNQIVDPETYDKPNWSDINAKYSMITLNQALTNNKSIIVSMLYKNLHRVLYNPLSFTKNAPSFFDLFFMEQPQTYMNDDLVIDKEHAGVRELETVIEMVEYVDKDNK